MSIEKMTDTQKKTLQFGLAIMGGLLAAALIASQPVKAEPFVVDHSDYDAARSDSESECRVLTKPDANGNIDAFNRCVQITLPDTVQSQNVPLETTPWGVYREPAEVAQALAAQATRNGAIQ
jgi:hypothetical protein